MQCGWVSAILWLSAGLYGYLIVHHEACLGQQRAINLRMIGLLLASLTFSVVDSFRYQPSPTLPPHAYWLNVGQFVISSVCAVFFVEIMDNFYHLNLWRFVRWLWLSLIPLIALSLLGWVVTPQLESLYLPLARTYYWRAESSRLGIAFSLLYLSGFVGAFASAFRQWHRLPTSSRITLTAMSVMIQLVVIDMLVYYGFLHWLPTWNMAYWVLAGAMSVHLNLQIHLQNARPGATGLSPGEEAALAPSHHHVV
ncbi:MAG: hypothetical protein C4337_07430 [Armatimonadota bacterium]